MLFFNVIFPVVHPVKFYNTHIQSSSSYLSISSTPSRPWGGKGLKSKHYNFIYLNNVYFTFLLYFPYYWLPLFFYYHNRHRHWDLLRLAPNVTTSYFTTIDPKIDTLQSIRLTPCCLHWMFPPLFKKNNRRTFLYPLFCFLFLFHIKWEMSFVYRKYLPNHSYSLT